MSYASGTRLGPYEILGQIGAGGMGEVYRARDTRLGREVAIKVLPATVSADPERVRRFEKEARSASSLNHPKPGQPTRLFRVEGVIIDWDAAADGQRFLIDIDTPDPAPISVLVNWPALLRKESAR